MSSSYAWKACALLLMILAASCAEDPLAPSDLASGPSWTAPPSIAGAELCQDCHAELVDNWSRTGMARTLGPVLTGVEGAPGELTGVPGAVDATSGFQYHFADAPDHTSFVLGETHATNPAFALGYEVLYGIGSGELDRSYAVAHGAQTWFAPMEVLTDENGRHGVLSPGASIAPGSRLNVPITAECLGCHTDALPPKTFPLHSTPSAKSWEPRGISCRACHGDGRGHVTWQESLDTPPTPDPILVVGSLDRFEQLSICAACHLQGDARIVLNGEELGPPKPGGDLLSQRALFVAATPTSEVGFVSQVERLSQSACFLESEMTCTTCHDPHRTLHDPVERQIVREACAKCHDTDMADDCGLASELDTEGQDCVSCHMPVTGVFDVAQVRIYDHFIRKDIRDALGATVEANLRFAESPSGDWKRFAWPGVEPPSHLDDLGLWMMAFAAGGHAEKALSFVDSTPGRMAESLPMYHHVRASLLGQSDRPAEAVESYRRALLMDPGLAPSAINLGLLLGELGDVESGLELLTKTIDKYPSSDGAYRNRSVLRLMAGDKHGFGEDLARAFSIAPTADLALALAKLYGELGEVERGKHWLDMAAQLRP